MSGLRTGIDNFATMSGSFERFHRCLNPPDHTFHIDIINFVYNFRRDVFDESGRRNTGVIDDNVESAELLSCSFYRSKNLFAV